MANKTLNHIGLAVLRIAPSVMMLAHGYSKLKKIIAGDFEFADPIGIGAGPSLFLCVIGEFICPILIIIGFKTRLASIPTLITMFVAAFVVHLNDAFAQKEKALLYLVIYACILLLGPGKYSVDKR